MTDKQAQAIDNILINVIGEEAARGRDIKWQKNTQDDDLTYLFVTTGQVDDGQGDGIKMMDRTHRTFRITKTGRVREEMHTRGY